MWTQSGLETFLQNLQKILHFASHPWPATYCPLALGFYYKKAPWVIVLHPILKTTFGFFSFLAFLGFSLSFSLCTLHDLRLDLVNLFSHFVKHTLRQTKGKSGVLFSKVTLVSVLCMESFLMDIFKKSDWITSTVSNPKLTRYEFECEILRKYLKIHLAYLFASYINLFTVYKLFKDPIKLKR